MEKVNDMQNKITDDELGEVSGGGSLENLVVKLNNVFGIKQDILDACSKTDKDS